MRLLRVPFRSTQDTRCSWDDDFPGMTRRGGLVNSQDRRSNACYTSNDCAGRGDITLVLQELRDERGRQMMKSTPDAGFPHRDKLCAYIEGRGTSPSLGARSQRPRGSGGQLSFKNEYILGEGEEGDMRVWPAQMGGEGGMPRGQECALLSK